jgi:DNA-binding SARP family transcriptional activator
VDERLRIEGVWPVRRPQPAPPSLAQRMVAVGRAAGSMAATLLVLAGIPAVLVYAVGWPLAGPWPRWAQVYDWLNRSDSTISPDTLIKVAAGIVWLMWAATVAATMFVAIVTAENALAARRRRKPRLRLPGFLRRLSAGLVGTTIVAISSTAARAAPPAHAANPAPVTAGHPLPATLPGPVTATTPTVDAEIVAPPAVGQHGGSPPTHDARSAVPQWARTWPGGFYRVRPGDTLWDIAAEQEGDPQRWRDWYQVTRGKPQATGYALHDPDVLHIGWVLLRPIRTDNPTHTGPPAPPAGGHHTEPGPATPQAGQHTPQRGHPDPVPGAQASTATSPTTPPPATITPTPPASAGSSPTVDRAPPSDGGQAGEHRRGVMLPSQAWVSLALAATIATVATLVRLRRRRRARLHFPIPLRSGPEPTPVPASLRPVDAAGSRLLYLHAEGNPLPGVLPAPPQVPAPIGLDLHGGEVSLFDLPGPGIALHGEGARPAVRAILAAALSTGVLQHLAAWPVVVTTADTLARLLPPGTPPVGLDPHSATFDGEQLTVLADTDSAVSHIEEEMIGRRRVLDSLDADTVTALNALPGHAEHQPPYVLLLEASERHAARIAAVGAQAAALHLHPVILGEQPGIPSVEVAADGTLTATPQALGLERLSTLAAKDLVDVLALVAEAAPRPEPGTTDQAAASAALAPGPEIVDIPAPRGGTPALVRLTVLGPVTVATEAGRVGPGMRSGSYATLALLAAHPHGRTLDQIATDIYPDAEPGAAIKRVRTDITTARRVLRNATGHAEAMFIVYDAGTGLYRLDPDKVEVDLWRMLTAISRANTTDNETECLAALREAANLYRGDFAANQDRAWIVDYATTYRHQILNAHARIAEIVEADQPDQAIAALEQAIEHDPVNEELYQRIMRIHGRQHRPDAVRRTLRILEDRLAEIGEAEPSEATRSVAARQLALRQTTSDGRHQPGP